TALGAAAGELFDFDEGAHALVARTSGWTFQLGRPVRVKIARVDLEARKLELTPAEDALPTGPPRDRRSSQQRRRENSRHVSPDRRAGKKSGHPPQSRQPGRRRRGR